MGITDNLLENVLASVHVKSKKEKRIIVLSRFSFKVYQHLVVIRVGQDGSSARDAVADGVALVEFQASSVRVGVVVEFLHRLQDPQPGPGADLPFVFFVHDERNR